MSFSVSLPGSRGRSSETPSTLAACAAADQESRLDTTSDQQSNNVEKEVLALLISASTANYQQLSVQHKPVYRFHDEVLDGLCIMFGLASLLRPA